MIYINIEDGKVVVENDNKKIVVNNIEELRKATKGHDAYVSSSIDFPEDWTDNEDTISLCREIRA